MRVQDCHHCCLEPVAEQALKRLLQASAVALEVGQLSLLIVLGPAKQIKRASIAKDGPFQML